MEQHSDSSGRWPQAERRRLVSLLGVAVIVIVADQVTKALVRASLHPGETWPEGWELIRFSHVHNTGAAFGILQGASTFLVIAPLIAIAAITVFMLTLPAHNRWYSIALAAILGGAVGNLIDRIRLGYVTDFIDPTHYPSFNIADSAIVLGVIAIGILSFIVPEEPDPVSSEDGEPPEESTHAEHTAESEMRS